MASRAATLLEILATRGAIARTSTEPNSWAVVALWRRFFQLGETEEHGEEQEQETSGIDGPRNLEFNGTVGEDHGIDGGAIDPINTPQMVQMRRDYASEYLRSATQGSRLSSIPDRSSSRTPDEVLTRPNLEVPTGDDYLYLAQ